MVVALLGQLALDGLEQIAIYDRWLLAGADLALVVDFANIEPVPKQMGEGASGEGDTADRPSISEATELCHNAATPELREQQSDAADLKVGPEYRADTLGLFLDNNQLPVSHLVTERHHAADPEPLALRCRDLVADALARHLSLELSK